MSEQTSLESSLNDSLALLKTKVKAGGPPAEYATRVHAAAEVVFRSIQATLERPYEVWAHKDSGLILKMNSVGLYRGTTFTYSRATDIELNAGNEDLYDRCQLVVIERFEVEPR